MNIKLIGEFIQYLQNIRKYSSNTIISYNTDLNQFLVYLGEYGDLDLSEITHFHIRSWIVILMEEGITAKSINRKISSLRSFFNYLRRQGLMSTNPIKKIVAPKTPKRLPHYIDEDKMNYLLEDNHLLEPNYLEARENIIISLLYHTGIRRSELLNLTISDINLQSNTIKVLGKGNKERIIPLNETISKELKDYLLVRQERFQIEDGVLILTDKGKPAYPKLIYNIVSKVLKKYNASEKVSPHVLRHTFATHLTANGAELNAVKELLGHASLAATQVYTHNSIERLKTVYDKAHPKSKS